MRTYKPGDTVSMDIDLRDESGIKGVSIRFGPTEGDTARAETTVFLKGDGRGQKQATVTVTGTVPDRILDGEYRCTSLYAEDTAGNIGSHHPEIRFRIEAPAGDFEGPDLEDWRFSEQ